MSIRIMTKRCIYCHRSYTYNPSIGNFGLFCKHCGKRQVQPLATQQPPKVPTTVPRFPRKPEKPI